MFLQINAYDLIELVYGRLVKGVRTVVNGRIGQRTIDQAVDQPSFDKRPRTHWIYF